ncbi:MAG: CBM9 family sugar-binding protein [Sedimentisphaerales bacterium]|nr:CBM9 family sugar-binding protein [Sedimentisphaerales bacterium]
MYRQLLFVLSLVVVLSLMGKAPAQDTDVLIRNPDIGMPVIDGVIDEPWSYATEQEIGNTVAGSTPSNSADCSGTWQALWSYDYIYALVVVNDEKLNNDSGSSSKWNDDSVEFYIDGDNSKGTTCDENDHQYTCRWNNNEVEEPSAIHNGEPSIVGFEYAVTTTGTGYIYEARIPWTSIMGEAPLAGQLIGIEVFINDDDDGGDRDSQIAWFGTDGNGWQDPSLWATALLVAGNKAGAPEPADGSIHPDTWATLRWVAGPTAVSHDVYMGTDYDAVTNATTDSEEFRGNQTLNYVVVGFPGFPYPEGLIPGTTYYWRVDEINAEGTVYQGVVWRFSIPPKTAYAPDPADGAEFVGPEVILNWTAGYGAKLHHVYLSDNWADVEASATAAYKGARGLATFSAGTLAQEKVYYWRIDEFDGIGTYQGDIWNFTTPGAVGNAKPTNAATGVQMTTTLTWTPASTATSHQVYFGTDKDAVRNATTASSEYKGSKALGNESYDPGQLDWYSSYYWRVDAVYATNTVQGPVWSFTTADFLLIDDFESYTDNDADGEAIWQTWVDGYGIADNGAQVGYLMPPYAEQAAVHSGIQAMPLIYENVNGVSNSEATLSLTTTRDWTAEGVGQLSLWFQGGSTNAANPMYVAVSNSSGSPAIVTNDDPEAALSRQWTEWIIPLQDFSDQGINLGNVNKIAIGLGSKGGASSDGSGKVIIDDIRLYRP